MILALIVGCKEARLARNKHKFHGSSEVLSWNKWTRRACRGTVWSRFTWPLNREVIVVLVGNHPYSWISALINMHSPGQAILGFWWEYWVLKVSGNSFCWSCCSDPENMMFCLPVSTVYSWFCQYLLSHLLTKVMVRCHSGSSAVCW